MGGIITRRFCNFASSARSSGHEQGCERSDSNIADCKRKHGGIGGGHLANAFAARDGARTDRDIES
jgi:hypothetical protein